MNGRSTSGAWRWAGPAVAVLLAAGVLGWGVGSLWPGSAGTPAIADDDWPPKIDVNKAYEDENEVGELLINDEVVIQLRADSKELSPHQRIVIVTERLKQQIKPRKQMTVGTGLRAQSNVVLVNDSVLLTPLPDDLPEGMTMREGAQIWAEAIAAALGIEPDEPDEPEVWEPAEPYEDKIVPIISLGKGKRIGAARVNGPQTSVRQVQAVAQIEAKMLKFFQVQIYVPISTKVPGKSLDRVEGVAVTGVGDFRL